MVSNVGLVNMLMKIFMVIVVQIKVGRIYLGGNVVRYFHRKYSPYSASVTLHTVVFCHFPPHTPLLHRAIPQERTALGVGLGCSLI